MNKEELLKKVDELIAEVSSHEVSSADESERDFTSIVDLKIRNLRSKIDLLDLKARLETGLNL